MIRAFIAVDLDPSVLQALRALQDELRCAGGDVRWVRPEGMHVTLKFLGPVEPSRLEKVQHAVVDAVADHPPLRVQVRGLGAFPNLRRPRVLWAGLQGKGLAELARGIETALVPLGFEAEGRAFNAHVTLGRVNSPRGWSEVEAQMRSHEADYFGASRVADVCIYSSTPQRGGSVYTLLCRAALGAR